MSEQDQNISQEEIYVEPPIPIQPVMQKSVWGFFFENDKILITSIKAVNETYKDFIVSAAVNSSREFEAKNLIMNLLIDDEVVQFTISKL